MFSSGYDLGDLADEAFAERGRAARRPPVHRRARRARRLPDPDARGAPRPHDRRRPRARARVRPAARRRRRSGSACRPRSSASSTRTPACAGSSRRSAPRARASCSSSAAHIDARTALTWGLVNAVVLPSDLEEESLEWAEELAANAPLSVRGNKRVIRELLRAGARPRPRRRARARSSCAGRASRSEDMREGVRAFAEKRPARWRGKLGRGAVAARVRPGGPGRGAAARTASRMATTPVPFSTYGVRAARERVRAPSRAAVNPDSATIRQAGAHASIAPIASRPCRRGIEMSSSTTSGHSSASAASPASPSPASPTTTTSRVVRERVAQQRSESRRIVAEQHPNLPASHGRERTRRSPAAPVTRRHVNAG